MPPNHSQNAAASVEFTELYMSNINTLWTNDQFQSLFETYGQIIRVNIVERPGGAFGFVDFNSPVSVVAAVEGPHIKKGEFSFGPGRFGVFRSLTEEEQKSKPPVVKQTGTYDKDPPVANRRTNELREYIWPFKADDQKCRTKNTAQRGSS